MISHSHLASARCRPAERDYFSRFERLSNWKPLKRLATFDSRENTSLKRGVNETARPLELGHTLRQLPAAQAACSKTPSAIS